jgi:hypothetical protein
MLAGQRLSIFETDDPQLCADGRIYLPRVFDIATTPEANADLFTLKTILAALALRDSPQQSGVPLADLARSVGDELPGLAERITTVQSELPPGTDIWQLMGRPVAMPPGTGDHDHYLEDEPRTPPEQITTEITGEGRASVEVLAADHLDAPGAEMPEHGRSIRARRARPTLTMSWKTTRRRCENSTCGSCSGRRSARGRFTEATSSSTASRSRSTPPLGVPVIRILSGTIVAGAIAWTGAA